MGKITSKIQHLRQRIALNRKTYLLYTILRALVIVTAIRCAIEGNYESLMLCILSLFLFLLPSFMEEQLKVELPPLFECIIYLFIYAAEILGEVNHYYTRIPGWDTMLHTLNGFLCAAIGFSLVNVLNRHSKNIKLSPFYVTVVGFCFSMTIGVIWEFIEFSADQLFFLDMQKDFIVQDIGSVTLDPTNSQIPYKISNITETLITTASGETYTIEGGYLDIGIIDTMKDLLVNFAGALIFSVMGYIYLKTKMLKERKNEGVDVDVEIKENRAANIAGSLMVTALSDEELQEQENQIMERRAAIEEERAARRKARQKNKNANAAISADNDKENNTIEEINKDENHGNE